MPETRDAEWDETLVAVPHFIEHWFTIYTSEFVLSFFVTSLGILYQFLLFRNYILYFNTVKTIRLQSC